MKTLASVALAVVVAGGGIAFAGPACCGAGKEAKEDKAGCAAKLEAGEKAGCAIKAGCGDKAAAGEKAGCAAKSDQTKCTQKPQSEGVQLDPAPEE